MNKMSNQMNMLHKIVSPKKQPGNQQTQPMEAGPKSETAKAIFDSVAQISDERDALKLEVAQNNVDLKAQDMHIVYLENQLKDVTRDLVAAEHYSGSLNARLTDVLLFADKLKEATVNSADHLRKMIIAAIDDASKAAQAQQPSERLQNNESEATKAVDEALKDVDAASKQQETAAQGRW